MAHQHNPHSKPSDFMPFCLSVYEASATYLDFDQYFEIYEELLKVLWYNPDIDNRIAIEQNPNPTGVVLHG